MSQAIGLKAPEGSPVQAGRLRSMPRIRCPASFRRRTVWRPINPLLPVQTTRIRLSVRNRPKNVPPNTTLPDSVHGLHTDSEIPRNLFLHFSINKSLLAFSDLSLI